MNSLHKIEILKTIEDANNEYLTNGRSDKFVAMEDEIIASQKMSNIYWFARYVRGANISKLQSEILKNGKMSDCFYFAKYVKGANFWAFFERALAEKNEFWVHKFVAMAASPFAKRKNGLRDYKDQLKAEYGIELDSKRKGDIQGLKNYNIDKIIEEANKEYSQNGRSKKFIQWEECAKFTTGKGADIVLFGKHVHGASIKNLQNSLIMHGDPFNMYLFAQEVKNSIPAALIPGTELAQYDYSAMEESEKDRVNRIKKCERDLHKAIESGKDLGKIDELREDLRLAESQESYSIMAKRCKARIEYLDPTARFDRR